MTTLLPANEPAAPVQGQPGHFAWSNWIMQAVKNLDAGASHSNDLNGRNKIINGDFSVNQRGFSTYSGVGGGVASYGLDRWQGLLSQASCAYSVQQAALGELPESAKQYARILSAGQAAVTDYAELQQTIESVRTLSGKTATISFWAKASAGTPKVAVSIQQIFGTGGSPSASVQTAFGVVTLTTAWARYSVTGTVPSISGKQVGTALDDGLAFKLWTSAGSNYTYAGGMGLQNATIDFWGVQVEEGSIATAYEQKSYLNELMACRRYWWRENIIVDTGGAFQAQIFSTPMRVAPTITGGGAGYTTASSSPYSHLAFQTTRAYQVLTFDAEL